MKKQFLLVMSICILFCSSAFAQLPLNFGVKLGANYSTLIQDADMSVNTALNPEYSLGFVGGGFVRLNIKKFYFQPELLFSSKGAKMDVTVPNSTNSNTYDVVSNVRVRFNNIDVPLILGYKLIDMKVVNFRILGGPLASFTLDGKSLSTLSPSTNTAKDYYEKAIWAYQVGVGVDIANFTFDARYEGNFSQSLDLSSAVVNGSTYNLGKPKVGLFQFSVGMKFL